MRFSVSAGDELERRVPHEQPPDLLAAAEDEAAPPGRLEDAREDVHEVSGLVELPIGEHVDGER